MVQIKSTLKQYMRVLQVAKKPTKEEFIVSGKVSAIGIALIGFIGFIIFAIFILTGLS
jgi:protein transport protein SEC61 subunit gamma-like protein